MKTKEFIEKVKKLGYSTQEADVDVNGCRIAIISIGLNGAYVGTVYPDEMYRFELKNISSNIIQDIGWDLMALILEYSGTQVSEREEEKKYYLKALLSNWQDKPFFLISSVDIGYYLSNSRKSEFTQKEIDKLPQSWKSFFTKVEV